ncbi:hypothetical protein GCM10027568_28240 [Humibacter soli]
MLAEVSRRVRYGFAVIVIFCLGVAASSGASAAFAETGGAPSPSPSAAAPGAAAVTWSVQPATAHGADGRAWAELTLNPGTSEQQYLELRNLGKTTTAFSLSAADGYFTEQGRFNMLPAGAKSKDAGLWVHIQPSIQLGAGQRAIIPYTVTVPSNATPGDHPAGVAASVTSVGVDKTGAQVGVVSRVGFRVMTRVTGTYKVAAASTINGSYALVWNPFQPGQAEVKYTLKNTGNTRVKLNPQVHLSGLFGIGAQTKAGDPVAELDPGETRTGVVGFTGVWPAGTLTASIDSSVDAVLKNTKASATPSPVRVSTSIPAFPWPQLLLVILTALVVVGLVADRRRRQRGIQQRIAAAREQGRQEAAQ